MAQTAPAIPAAQPPVGVPCELVPDQHEAVITLLRVIECLPALSETEGLTAGRALRVLAVIHANHLHLAARARALLVAHPERACPDPPAREADPALHPNRRSAS